MGWGTLGNAVGVVVAFVLKPIVWQLLIEATLATGIALWTGLGARTHPSKLPWMTSVIQHPELFGGQREILRHARYMTIWIAIAVVIVCSAANLFLLLMPKKAGGIGFVVALFASIALYVWCNDRAKRIVKARREPSSIDESQNDFGAEGFTETAIRALNISGRKFTVAARLAVGVVPILMAAVYDYFYRRVGVVLRGCGFLLVDAYGIENIRRFYAVFREGESDSRLVRIDEAIADCAGTPRQVACTIAIGLVRLHGYRPTEVLLRQSIPEIDGSSDPPETLRLLRCKTRTRIKKKGAYVTKGKRGRIKAVCEEGKLIMVVGSFHCDVGEELQVHVGSRRPIRSQRKWLKGEVVHRGFDLTMRRYHCWQVVEVQNNEDRQLVRTHLGKTRFWNRLDERQ